MTKKVRFYKNFIWNIVGTTTNAFISLIFMILVTRFNGLEEAGIFSFSFSNACVLYCIGIYMGRTYQISDHKHSEKSFLRVRLFTCALMIAISAVMVMYFGYSVRIATISILWAIFKMLDAFSDFIYGVMQKHDELYRAGISLTSKAVISMLFFIVVDYFTRNLLVSSFAAVVANLLIVLLYDVPYYNREREERKSNKEEFVFLLRDGFFVAGTTLLTNFLMNASKYAMNSNGNNKEQAILGIIIMPASFMVLAGQYLIHPYLMRITILFKEKREKELSALTKRMSLTLFGIGVIAMIAAYIFGIFFLELVYGVELSQYKIDLCIIIMGATCYGIAVVLINILTVMRKTKIQFNIFLVIAFLSYYLSSAFVKTNGITGACVAYLITMTIVVFVFSAILKKEIGKIALYEE